MSGNSGKGRVMQSLEELEKILEKAQIVRGGNSERRSFAGSDWEDQNMPTSTPNGTDWVPPKKMARKAMDQMPVEELEKYLQMRKSNMANPIAAESEILNSVPGVEKAICPTCEGTQKDVISKSVCGKCNGFGFVWMVPNKESYSMVKSIEAKWNVHKAVQHAHGKQVDGGEEGADITPKDGNTGGTEEKPKTVESSPNPSVKKALEKAKKEVKKMIPGKDEEMIEEESDDGEGDEEALEELLASEGTEKCATKKSTKKSINPTVLSRSLDVIFKALLYMNDRQDSIGSTVDGLREIQAEQADLVNGMSHAFVDVQKGLNEVRTTGSSRPARNPKSVMSNVQPLNKGFVDQAPNSQEADGGPRYDFMTLKKGATKMAIEGKLDKRVGLRMDAGDMPDDKIIKSLESFIDENGID